MRSAVSEHAIPTPLRNAAKGGQPYPPDLVARVRALIESEGLSQREAAARAGLGVDTVGRWARRFGWRRANVGGKESVGSGAARSRRCERSEATQEPLAHACGRWVASSASPPRNDGGPRRTGRVALAAPAPSKPRRPRHYGPDVREAARVRVEGTRDGLERIANELGIARWTLHDWAKRSGWRRPAPPERLGPTGTVGPMFYRSRRFGRPYGGDAVGTARDLVTGSNLPLDRVAARAGVSRATLYRWIARRGWTRQRSVTARRPRYRPPYPPAIVAAARELYQTTGLSTRMIAARAKTTRERVRHWARTNGWIRPYDLPGPHDWPAPHDGSAPHDGLARHDGSGLHGSVRRGRRSRTTGRRTSAAR